MKEAYLLAKPVIQIRKRQQMLLAILRFIALLNGNIQVSRPDAGVAKIPESIEQGIPKSPIA